MINNENIRILILSSNPLETTRIRLDEEMRSIDHVLRLAEFRDRFDIKQHWAVRVSDLQSYLLRHNPHIVHFSGHGEESRGIVLEDTAGKSSPVSAKALSKMFSVLKRNIKCVVLNTCFSEEQAKAISEHIDCVIGMSNRISDKAAISFSASFYQALGYGQDLKTAFELGCVQLDLENLEEYDIPKFITNDTNAVSIFPDTVPIINESIFANNETKESLNIEIAITLWIRSTIYDYAGNHLIEMKKIADLPGMNYFLKLENNFIFGVEVAYIQNEDQLHLIISRYLRMSKKEISNFYTKNEDKWVEPMLILVTNDIKTVTDILDRWRNIIKTNIDSWVVIGHINGQMFEELFRVGAYA